MQHFKRTLNSRFVLYCASVLLFNVYHTDAFDLAFDADEDVIFRLYKREESATFSRLTINGDRSLSNDTLFDPKIPTKIHIHGYWGKEEIIDRYREVYLSVGDYNFIVIDWLEGAVTINYLLAKKRIKDVSERE